MLTQLNHTREVLLGLIAVIWVVAVAGIFAFTGDGCTDDMPLAPVVVTHWVSSHLMREGLLPQMAEEFNQACYKTRSGRPVVVDVYDVPPSLQAEYLAARTTSGKRIDLPSMSGIPIDPNIPDPTIVTPSSAHWFVKVNHEVGHNVVNLAAAESIVRPFIGIVTYQDMAECLGWPEKELGYADILALRAGWGRYPSCAKAEWGSRPLVAYTDPTTSSTGRSLLLGLYSIAAEKPPEELSLSDVSDPKVVAYIKEFQGLIDHYTIGTTVLNTKIHQGPRYGHFFIMPEDNLIQLIDGPVEAYFDGVRVAAPPIERAMVMIYPKEGAMPRTNCACIVQEDWVTAEHLDAAEQWIDFILADAQQRAFMAAGFRPGTDMSINDPESKINARYGLDPRTPPVLINPSLTHPAVAAAIDASWEDVKRPGIVTFVLDTSASMSGPKIERAREGLIKFIDAMYQNGQIGLVTFSDAVDVRIPVAPLETSRLKVADTIKETRAEGESALYDSIADAIEMTDKAHGAADAIRAVVVLTDGKATGGLKRLHDLIVMRTGNEECLVQEEKDQLGRIVLVDQCTDSPVDKRDVTGNQLAKETDNRVQIFYIGVGDNADIQVGRMLAEATGGEYVSTAEDLAKIIERLVGYF